MRYLISSSFFKAGASIIFTDSGKRLREVNLLAQCHTAINEQSHTEPQVGLTEEPMLLVVDFQFSRVSRSYGGGLVKG